MESHTFDLYEIRIVSKNDRLYYSYLDENNKLEKDYSTDTVVLKNLYISDNGKNQVYVEYWGRQGKIKKKKITKFYFTEKQYEKLYEKFEWKDDIN